MTTSDLYAVLGILPDAEDVVIIAAYRALAQRYHPDKWKGDPVVAHDRMALINHAFSILGDQACRSEYDRSCATDGQPDLTADSDEDRTAAFASALAEVEDRWRVACSVFPDLHELRARLARVSTSLSFAFVSSMLEAKAFADRVEVAEHLEHAFLQRYFGTNAEVIKYASSLVQIGHRPAARALNKLVDVLGSSVDSALIIDRIEQEFGVRRATQLALIESVSAEELARSILERSLLDSEIFADARKLASLLGCTISDAGGGIFAAPAVLVRTPDNEYQRFKTRGDFVRWVQDALCVRT
ncbi:MAG: curved DNA-binding protein CbpA [Candidatus Accumulibacter regalis]|jgi:DnaJ-class molecular chaperone